ncbi:MAG TPA: DUF1987 domain-containing protein [Flavobacteriales bacterium]|nr:DUF1987 domain-containing protein [Flavobacteriales bacterium]
MENFTIPATRNTPAIEYDAQAGRCSMSGISVPENASEFYQPLIERLFRIDQPAPGTTFHFRLNYFNSSSLKAIYLLLNEVKKGVEDGRDYKIEWCVEHEDEFMQEAAETFTELLGVPLTVLPME